MRIARLLLLLSLAFAVSCRRPPNKKPGLCLSFDDRSIKEWYEMRPLLAAHSAQVTFFISQFDSLDSVEVSMLKDLERDGHEIASHGARHVLSENYIKEKSFDEYLTNEIDASISSMARSGFAVRSFAYPYGAKYWFTDMILLRKFDVVRGVEPVNDEKDLSLMDDIYYKFDGDRTVSAVGIDKQSGLTKEMIKKAISRAVENREVLLLYGHSPSTHLDHGPYTFDPDLLSYVLDEAMDNHLTFMRCMELRTHP